MATRKERLAGLQAQMRSAGVELAAIGSTANLRYLLGFAPHADERFCVLLVSATDVRMVTPTLNQPEIAAHTDVPLVGWTDVDGPAAALKQALGQLPAPRVLAVDGAMRADFLLRLQDALTVDKTVPADTLVAPLRQIKTADEVEALARAAAQADRAMQAAVKACRVGATEAQIAWAAEAAFRQDGAEMVDFTIVASGPNGAFPHHHSTERKLQDGDAIVIDIGATLEGHKSDITRMVFLGTPPAEFTRAYAAVLDANQRGTAAVRPGIAAQDIDRAARAAIESAGFGKYFSHRTGHGIGLEGHEPPWIMEGNSQILREGMAFSVEPGVYFVGQFGIRIEDIVVVTPSGVRTLTGFDHALVVKT
jgi:Xaa-Pro aminopeptidase